MRKVYLWAAATAAGFLCATTSAHAAFLPVTKGDFAPTKVTNTFTFETVTYNSGDAMPNHTLTIGFGANKALLDSHTGADTGGTANDNYMNIAASNVGGVIRDTRDFQAGNIPTGPAGYLSIDATNTNSSFDQTLTGTAFQPFTQYTLTVTVFDRQFGATDQYSFPGKVTLFFTGGGTNIVGGTQTLADPAAGSKTTGTLVFTTGDTAPTGDLGFRFKIQNFKAGTGIVASQAVFDDITIEALSVAAPTPEPASLALLGVGSMLIARRRRVN